MSQFTILLVWYIAVAAIGTVAYLYQELLHPFFRRLWQHNYTVEAVNQLDRKTFEVTLAPVAQPVSFVAGQFVFVRFGGGHGWERHPFTVSSAPQEPLLHLSIKGLGEYTQRLIDTLQPGIPACVGRAFGMFGYRRGGRKQVWIAGGIGITPFRSWMRAFPTEQPLEFDIDLCLIRVDRCNDPWNDRSSNDQQHSILLPPLGAIPMVTLRHPGRAWHAHRTTRGIETGSRVRNLDRW